MERIKGKLKAIPRDEELGSADYDLYLEGKWVARCIDKNNAKAIAQHFVSCWNAFEPDGLVERIEKNDTNRNVK